ncbi:MAG: M20/M25/M40 family metallo-hydrolase [Bacteroidia bacterium]|nr:M20/M25/M40 family metallo-hydrolase [Bacteroidia bacterium]
MLQRLSSLLSIMACLLIAVPVQAQDPLQSIRVDVVYLASDYLQGRETGTQGEVLAADYIASRFEAIGLTPKGSNGWFQSFDFTFNTNPHADPKDGEPRTGNNVLGYIDNGAATTVVIGAHYDHLGHGAFGSRAPGDSSIHNGADDNASGVAALIEIATQLKASEANKNNYLFLAFSGEELGLYGSKHFVNAPTLGLDQINYMINLDMVGRLNEEKVLAVNGAGTSPSWKTTFETMNVQGLTLKLSDSGVGPSDHTSFYLKEIPVLHLFTGQHQDYHKPADDSELINFEGIQTISDFVVELVQKLNKAGKLEYEKTKDEQQGREAARYKVSLGVMPDYVSNGEGMRIDAVLDGRPAQAAGLLDGDVIIKIGDKDVADVYGYMEALGNYSKGDETTVIVKRGEETVTVTVTF